MNTQVKSQASKLWQQITDPATAETYQKAFSLTGTLIKETGYLLWLVLCLFLIFGEWFWKYSYGTGWKFRHWINNIDQPTTDRLLSETGRVLLTASKTSAFRALSTAKEQLGIEDDQSELVATSAPATTTPTTPAPTPEPVKPAATPAPATATATSSATQAE